jgi:4,4'-diaponeurosporenoate glycosyltransferase
MVGLVLAVVGNVATDDWILWGGIYFACAVQLAWLSRRVGAFRWFTTLLYPVPLLFFFVVFAWSKARSGRDVRWKGRTIRAH